MSESIITCSGCGKQYKWTPKVAGMSAKCRCGATVKMPKEAPAATGAPAPPTPTAPTDAAPDADTGGIPLGDNPLFSLDTPLSMTEETAAPAETPAPQVGAAPLDLSDDTDGYGVEGTAANLINRGAPQPCPSCKAEVAPGAVLCVNCGFNLATGKVVGGALAEEEEEEEDAAAADGYTKKYYFMEYWLPTGLIIGGFILGVIGTYVRAVAAQNLFESGADTTVSSSISLTGYTIAFTVSTIIGTIMMVAACLLASHIADIAFGDARSAILKFAAVYVVPTSLSQFVWALSPEWGLVLQSAIFVIGWIALMLWLFDLDMFEIGVCFAVSYIVEMITIMFLFTGVIGYFTETAKEIVNGPTIPFVQDIDLEMTSPDVVSVGEEFKIVVTVSNTDAKDPQTLFDIDFEPEYLEGIEIVRAEPRNDRTVKYTNYTSYVFNDKIDPHKSQTVTFIARATKPGVYYSDMRVSINLEQSFRTLHVLTAVKPKGDATPAAKAERGPPREGDAAPTDAKPAATK
ncbi:MAG: hypothetical protein GC159_01605 [Phycisphaera sp.]|nr:hypothetical protein [Phycisphaera sp.]